MRTEDTAAAEFSPGTESGFPSAEELQKRLSDVLSDPESMGRLMKMASGLASSGLFSGMDPGNTASDTEGTSRTQTPENGTKPDPGEAAGDRADTEHTGKNEERHFGKGHGDGGKHAALLRALRPYMSGQRQARIDQMLGLLQLAQAAEAILKMQSTVSDGNGKSG